MGILVFCGVYFCLEGVYLYFVGAYVSLECGILVLLCVCAQDDYNMLYNDGTYLNYAFENCTVTGHFYGLFIIYRDRLGSFGKDLSIGLFPSNSMLWDSNPRFTLLKLIFII